MVLGSWTKNINGEILMENKIGFFFKNQIWHIGGLIILFYLGCQLVDFENNSNTFLGISGNSMVG